MTTQSESRTYNGQKWTLSSECTKVDAILNTIGFPLVGGPAGSMEGGIDMYIRCIFECFLIFRCLKFFALFYNTLMLTYKTFRRAPNRCFPRDFDCKECSLYCSCTAFDPGHLILEAGSIILLCLIVYTF